MVFYHLPSKMVRAMCILNPTSRPILRLSGRLESVEMDPITPEEVREFIEQSVPAEFYDLWVKNRQVDYSYSAPGGGRFRVNGFLAARFAQCGDAPRERTHRPPLLNSNHGWPDARQLVSLRKNGIVLLCGATGSGKSSTLAAMVNHINHTL